MNSKCMFVFLCQPEDLAAELVRGGFLGQLSHNNLQQFKNRLSGQMVTAPRSLELHTIRDFCHDFVPEVYPPARRGS